MIQASHEAHVCWPMPASALFAARGPHPLPGDEDELLLLVDDRVHGHTREAGLDILRVVRHLCHRLRLLRRPCCRLLGVPLWMLRCIQLLLAPPPAVAKRNSLRRRRGRRLATSLASWRKYSIRPDSVRKQDSGHMQQILPNRCMHLGSTAVNASVSRDCTLNACCEVM